MPTEIGPLSVRRSIWIDATPERVWDEFGSLEKMRAWFGTGHKLLQYEPRKGGRVELDCADEGEPPMRFGGKILVYDPPHELTFEDAWIPPIWDAPMLLTIRLTPHIGGTNVELFVHAFERLGPPGPDAHRGYEGGWTIRQLNELRQIVENRAA
jgi:uncharacterized protein YndB with AHSA1/START domain